MNTANNKVIGIVGGMGPQSGINLNNSIVSQTSAGTDQQHLSTILMSFPGDIGDRTLFLDGQLSMNPAYNIIPIIKKMEIAGASIIGMACNTAHSPEIFEIIAQSLEKDVTMLNMPLETCEHIRQQYRHVRRIGVLATNGTYKSGIYTNSLLKMGFTVADPGINFQTEVIHKMIYHPEFGIKATSSITPQVKLLLKETFSFFEKSNVDAVILGCTEFSLLNIGKQHGKMIIVDSTDVFAKALIREATNQRHAVCC
jgi:aspartate racemase